MQNLLQNRYIFINFAYIKIGHCPNKLKLNSRTKHTKGNRPTGKTKTGH